MDIIKKNIKRILLTLLILFVISLIYQVAAAQHDYMGYRFYSEIINNEDNKCKNWYCIESNQHIEKYLRSSEYGVWDNVKKVSIDTTNDADSASLWHVLGAIAYEGQSQGTFDWGHKPSNHAGSGWSGDATTNGWQLQGYVWELIAKYPSWFQNKLGIPSLSCPKCTDCKSIFRRISYGSTESYWDQYLNDGWDYKYTIYIWERIPKYNNYEKAQRLIHITVSRTKKIEPVTLDFSKINTAGNGVAGAKLTLSSNTSGITLSSNSLTSAADGKFGTVKVTPTTNTGTFKINLTEVAPKGYLGIPNDVVLTVSYKNGSVTRNKRRNSK